MNKHTIEIAKIMEEIAEESISIEDLYLVKDIIIKASNKQNPDFHLRYDINDQELLAMIYQQISLCQENLEDETITLRENLINAVVTLIHAIKYVDLMNV